MEEWQSTGVQKLHSRVIMRLKRRRRCSHGIQGQILWDLRPWHFRPCAKIDGRAVLNDFECIVSSEYWWRRATRHDSNTLACFANRTRMKKMPCPVPKISAANGLRFAPLNAHSFDLFCSGMFVGERAIESS